MTKPGRNDHCPCGSGKKYKHCCLVVEVAAQSSPQELAWRRLRHAIEVFPPQLLEFAVNECGAFVVGEAWEEFCLPGSEAFDPHTVHMQAFLPWMYHHWIPDNDALPVSGKFRRRTLAQAFIDHQGSRTDPLLKKYLMACEDANYSFYELIRVDYDHGFRVRDIFTGEEVEVLERSASRAMKLHDILYGMLVACDGIVLLEAVAPTAIPPINKIEIIGLRAALAPVVGLMTDMQVRKHQVDLRALYWGLIEPILNPQMPQLRNTDDEDYLPQKVVFDIESPQAVFEALKHLALNEHGDTLSSEAIHDEAGQLVSICLDWLKLGNSKHQAWDNTLMGRIAIDGTRMMVSVNSAERAATIRKLVEELPEARARYRVTEIQSLQQAMAEMKESRTAEQIQEQDDLQSQPEVQAHLRDHFNQFYKQWLHDSLPVLGGKTPMQAVKTRDGREIVAALVNDIERVSARQAGFDPEILVRLRTALGLN